MSTSLNKTKSNKDESFNIEIGDKSTDEKQIYDLNEIFHIDLSYNFDLLKKLLSSIIKNQKLKDDRITELENQILDLRIAYNDGVSPNSGDIYPRKAFDGKNSLLSPYKEGENGEYLDPEEEEKLNYELKPPKKGPELEISDENPPVVNKIIVSKKIIKNIFLFFYYIGKNSWNR